MAVVGAGDFIGAAFAEAGLRALAQSMARELGPQGIHVAHLVIDAGVDTEWVRARIAAREGETAERLTKGDLLMRPRSIAEAYRRRQTPLQLPLP